MFIKSILIKNFKCFGNDSSQIEFNLPDNKNLGSGYNILIGENNTGKSTVFEAIDFLRDGTKKDTNDIRNKNASLNDDILVELIFSGNVTDVIDAFSQENKKNVFKKYIYKLEDIEYFKLCRSSSNIKAIQLWDNSESIYKNESGIDAPLKKLFETNFVWADTNPNDQVNFGSTTLCGNLLKEIVNKFIETEDYKKFTNEFNKTFNSEECGLRKELKNIEKRTQEIFSEQFGSATISFHFNELKVDSFFKNTKIEIDDGFVTFMEEKGSGMQRSVALALLQVYAEELIKHPDNDNIKKPFFLFIDEPEICLHPQAQNKLNNALLQLSKNQQIFITTHSPYYCVPNIIEKIYRFSKLSDNQIMIYNLINKDIMNKIKNGENRYFFFRHRDMFFANKVIFVEGANDFERYIKYCENNNFINLIEHFYMMNGCDHTIFFENLCKEIGINFYAIVDKDFSIKRSKWVRDDKKRTIKAIKEFIKEKNIQFDEIKFDKEIEEDLKKEEKYTGEKEIEDFTYNNVILSKVKNRNIIVLKYGEVKDYLNIDGNIIEDGRIEKEKELSAIFNFIRDKINE